MDTTPIFIAGISFSGKTLLGSMLNAHPNISITRRTYMWTRYYNRFGDLSVPQNFERCLESMLNSKSIRLHNPDVNRIRQEFFRGKQSYARLFALFHEQFAERAGKRRWGDQLGFIEQYADPIFAAYPQAKMIHMLRDPVDRCAASISSSRYRRGKVGSETAYWLCSARLARCNQERYPGKYCVILYEDLISQLLDTLRKVCAFLAEAYDERMLDGKHARRYLTGQQTGSADHLDKLHQKNGYPSISGRESTFIQAVARQEMLAFGYHPQRSLQSVKDWLLYYSLDLPVNLTGMAIRQARWNVTPAFG